MGSQTYIEDFYSSYKSTWTISFSSSSEYNVIASNETLTISSPTVTAKYVGSSKGYAVVDISGGIYDKDPTWGEGNFLANWKRYRGTIKNGETQRIATTSGTTYTLSVGGTFIGSNDATFNVTASSLFDENNKNTSYVYLWAKINYGVLESSDSSYDRYNAYPNYGWGQNYDNAMTAIKINYRCPPSVTIGSPSYANPQYAGFGAYSVPLTKLVAEYGGNITSVKLTVGASSTTQTYSTNTVTNKTISVVPSTAGKSITPILEVTDSRGVVNYQTLSPIDVLEYDKPSVNFDVYRTDSIGKKADEGKYAIIDAQVTFTSGAVTIKEKPTVIIDGTDKTSNVTWYPNWNASDGKSGNEITTWSSVSSGSHIYGLINGNFSETSSYSVTMTAKDTSNKVSDPITQTLSTAFYTIDFQAGGKEIAFGAPANDDLTNINGKNYLDEGLFKCNMGTSFNDMTTGTGGEVEEFISELDINGAGINLTQSDWIVEQGINGIWMWRKWQSGLAECWGQYSYTSSTSTVWSAPLYYSDSVSAQPYPFTFKSIPMEWASVDSSTNALWLYKESSGHNTVSSTAVYRPIKVSAFSSNTFDIRYYVVGRWK